MQKYKKKKRYIYIQIKKENANKWNEKMQRKSIKKNTKTEKKKHKQNA